MTRRPRHDRHQEGLPQARARQPPRLQPGRHRQAREVQGGRRGLRRHRRRGEAQEVRRGPRLYAGGGFRGGFPGGTTAAAAPGFDLGDLLRDRTAAAASATCSATSSVAAAAAAAAPAPRPVRGADVESSATIGFTDALDGVTISLRLTSDAACPDCHGTGGKPGTQPKICPECEGAGFVVNSMGGGFSINETCPRCGGRQLVYDEACPTCHGSGRGTSSRTHPGPHPRRGQGRPAHPAARQGRRRREWRRQR